MQNMLYAHVSRDQQEAHAAVEHPCTASHLQHRLVLIDEQLIDSACQTAKEKKLYSCCRACARAPEPCIPG